MLRIYLGHHKCASTFLADIIGDICGRLGWTLLVQHQAVELPFNLHKSEDYAMRLLQARSDWFRASANRDFLVHRNADFRLVNHLRTTEWRGFHVIRDPRDVVVSGYFSHLYSHRLTPPVARQRKILQNLTTEEGLLAELDFFQSQFRRLLAWDFESPNVLELKFEELIPNLDEGIKRILDFLEIPLHQEDIREILMENSFHTRTGRSPGEEDQHSKFRKGIVGDWKNYFTARVEREFRTRYGDLLRCLGYE